MSGIARNAKREYSRKAGITLREKQGRRPNYQGDDLFTYAYIEQLLRAAWRAGYEFAQLRQRLHT